MSKQSRKKTSGRWWPIPLLVALIVFGLGLWLEPLTTIQITIGLFGAALITKMVIVTYRDFQKKYGKRATSRPPANDIHFPMVTAIGDQTETDSDRPTCFRPSG